MSIYSDFFEYRDSDTRPPLDPVRSTLYVIDANVLLNLFKFTRSATAEILSAMKQMSSVLFVPHQVMNEFWSNVATVRRGDHHREAAGKMSSAHDEMERVIGTWLERTGLVSERDQVVQRSRNARDDLSRAVSRVIEIFEEVEADASDGQRTILPSLEKTLHGRVGDAPTPEQRRQWIAEFSTRVAARIPPGFRDAESKNGESAAGDYLIWRQILDRASAVSKERQRPVDVTFITNDLKDDWVREPRSSTAPLAHRHLIREFAEQTGNGVFRIGTFRALLEVANEHFGAAVSEESRAQAQAQSRLVEAEWPVEAVRDYLKWLLEREYTDQLLVLFAAVNALAQLEEGITIEHARTLTGRDKLTAFSPPYRTALRQAAVQEAGISEPAIALESDGVFRATGIDQEVIDRAIGDDEDLAECRDRAVAFVTGLGAKG